MSPFHIASSLLILGGMVLLLYCCGPRGAAQKVEQVATAGPYGCIRHPQYAAFILVMLGFFIQWPTIVTGVLPILWVLYVRLAISEERDSVERFGLNYVGYAERTPRFNPKVGRSARVYEVARPLSEA